MVVSPSISWLFTTAAAPSAHFRGLALKRQLQLTKPAGSLGRLEEIAVDFAAFQKTEIAVLDNVRIVVFAADHGFVSHGVSAFPQCVTEQMLHNFAEGGAAINVLSRAINAELEVVNLGLASGVICQPPVIDCTIAAGTQDFTTQAAMDPQQCVAALNRGREFALKKPCQLLIGGEMGIGNTTSASALYSALLKLPAEQTVGPGTGIDAATQKKKATLIYGALQKHSDAIDEPLAALSALGGFEIAALTGMTIAAAQAGIPVLVDGFISTAAALLAVSLNQSVRPWLLFAHQSAEPAHSAALKSLNAQPLLNLRMRLGEASGAAAAVPLLRLALLLHGQMATFAQAGVADEIH